MPSRQNFWTYSVFCYSGVCSSDSCDFFRFVFSTIICVAANAGETLSGPPHPRLAHPPTSLSLGRRLPPFSYYIVPTHSCSEKMRGEEEKRPP